jgi:hypothetical protein
MEVVMTCLSGRANVVKHGLQFGFSLLILASVWGCNSKPSETTQANQAQPVESPATVAKVPEQPAPTEAEVKEAVARIFRDSAVIDSSSQPSFFAGDFNGDGSNDIAIILKPTPGRLGEMNQQFPPWILRNLFVLPKPGDPPIQIAQNDMLLAIIHGYGSDGWRDSQATQTYLLKNAVGQNLKAQKKSEVAEVNKGVPLPRLSGDMIGETLRGKNGYLYFTGAQYSWYDPKTFKGEAEVKLTHPGIKPKPDKFDLLHPKFVPAEK